MSKPMEPEEAQAILDAESGRVLGNITRRAVETIAGMTVQEDWHLVDPFTNGGAYEKRRYTRMVSEWVADEGTP